jgi:hypothetical protein
MGDAPGELKLLKLGRKSLRHSMTTNVCFTNAAPSRIDAASARFPLLGGCDVTASGRTEAVEMTAQVPILAIVFTVSGPMVYQPSNPQMA